MNTEVKPKFRADGWPLCPCCGEDELMSQENNPSLSDDLKCLGCGWHGKVQQPAEKPLLSDETIARLERNGLTVNWHRSHHNLHIEVRAKDDKIATPVTGIHGALDLLVFRHWPKLADDCVNLQIDTWLKANNLIDRTTWTQHPIHEEGVNVTEALQRRQDEADALTLATHTAFQDFKTTSKPGPGAIDKSAPWEAREDDPERNM